MRRAMHVIEGKGPQEVIDLFALYDHPYFGQLFLAAALATIGYPDTINPTPVMIQSIQILYLIPKILMALLAVGDTFLVYKIAERRYNNVRIALISSILFAVMPITWLLRNIWLENIQLLLLLCSIFFAVSVKSHKTSAMNGLGKMGKGNKNNLVLILLSGIFLGLAIFTKVPAFTMIPLVAFLIASNSDRGLKSVRIWILPVLVIPILWPAYSIISGQFSSWLHGIYFQSTREGLSLLDSMQHLLLHVDPFVVGIGMVGLLFAIIKKDLFIVLWIIPFLLFLYFIGTTAYFHLIPIIPAFCLGPARLIDSLLSLISSKGIQKLLSFVAVSVLVSFGLIFTIPIISQKVNQPLIDASAFISKYLYENTTRATHDAITVISNPFYLWIPQYVFDLEGFFVPYYSIVSIKSDEVLLVEDNSFVNALKSDPLLLRLNNLLGKQGLNDELFKKEGAKNSGVTLVWNNISQAMIEQNHTLNLLDDNHVWTPFGDAVITREIDNSTLQIRINNYSSTGKDDVYSGASLFTRANLSRGPLLLSLNYISESSSRNPTFYAEITEVNKNGKSLTDLFLNTFYTEITEKNYKSHGNPLDDILETFYAEIRKNSTGRIIWNDILDNTNGKLAKETYVFPRLGAETFDSINDDDSRIELRLYVIRDSPGKYELTLDEALVASSTQEDIVEFEQD